MIWRGSQDRPRVWNSSWVTAPEGDCQDTKPFLYLEQGAHGAHTKAAEAPGFLSKRGFGGFALKMSHPWFPSFYDTHNLTIQNPCSSMKLIQSMTTFISSTAPTQI